MLLLFLKVNFQEHYQEISVKQFKPQLHCHDFGHNGATTHSDLSSRDASA